MHLSRNARIAFDRAAWLMMFFNSVNQVFSGLVCFNNSIGIRGPVFERRKSVICTSEAYDSKRVSSSMDALVNAWLQSSWEPKHIARCEEDVVDSTISGVVINARGSSK